jgi:NADH dehydrogenase
MILVAGGTGRLGTLVVAQLAQQGARVRVLTRDPARAAHLRAAGAEVARGDVRDRSSVERAMGAVTTVVSAVHGFAGPGRVTPDSVDRAGNAHLVAAAAAARADVVLVSVAGAAADSPMELFRAKYAAEQNLRASGVPWTIVRASAFAEMWADIMTKPIVFGRGNNPVNFVSVTDVAAAVARAAAGTELRGQIITVAGPDNLTFNQLAALLQELRGRHGPIRHVPRWLLRAMAPASRQARAAIAMDTTDMTTGPPAALRRNELPTTDIRTALTTTVTAPQPSSARYGAGPE